MPNPVPQRTHSHTHYCTRKAFMVGFTVDSASVSERRNNHSNERKILTNLRLPSFEAEATLQVVTCAQVSSFPFFRPLLPLFLVFARIFMFPTTMCCDMRTTSRMQNLPCSVLFVHRVLDWFAMLAVSLVEDFLWRKFWANFFFFHLMACGDVSGASVSVSVSMWNINS